MTRVKPDAQCLRQLAPAVSPDLVRAHLERLGDDYFDVFDEATVARHLQALDGLQTAAPVCVLAGHGPDGHVECTVLGFDHPSEFALITGVLAASGMSILSGHVFTYRRMDAVTRRRPGRRGLGSLAPHERRCIIDQFAGRLEDVAPDAWERAVRADLSEVLGMLEQGGARSADRARRRVNELVAGRLGRQKAAASAVFYPVELEAKQAAGGVTTLRVASQDTPAFLYALSNALSLQGISIEGVRINTVGERVEDEIDLVDERGERIADPDRLDRIKFSVLLTKQFTYFLPGAPDPFAALERFEKLAGEVQQRPERAAWAELLSRPEALQDLARILGASDFLWEDFVRLQYESLLPLLQQNRRRCFSIPALRKRLEESRTGAGNWEARREALNAWKDREIYLIDMDHILHAGADVQSLAEPLTRLAGIVVEEAVQEVYGRLVERYGVPRTVGGLETVFSVFGLGKFGGVALGYASDIELLFVYRDAGRTDGPADRDNGEFFDELAAECSRYIAAKREGIFRVDLRLRPYGNSGPRACSLESFCRYYGPEGGAHSYERLALVRLRCVGGDAEFGRQVERLRDEYVYESRLIRLDELQELRERQLSVKAGGEELNAKFSPGALVDLEYFVQLLQVLHGGDVATLRTPRLHEALEAMSTAGIMRGAESRSLADAYYFLRRLINGLRMLRGNALDLFLPARDSDEYGHLARRMGYRSGALDAAQQLHVDFETHTAVVRAFIERHFGRERLSDPTRGSVADLVLSRDPAPELLERVCRKAGLANHGRALVNLRALAGAGARRDALARVAVVAADVLARQADPDMALNNWERFVDRLPDAGQHFVRLLEQPRRLELLLGLFSGSQFLADALARYPEFLEWVTDPEILHGTRDVSTLSGDLSRFLAAFTEGEAWLDGVRRFRRRELLRIGMRDLCLQAPLEEITADLSAAAETVLRAALAQVAAEAGVPVEGFCVGALGKLGGGELNYSSDIDLVGFCRRGAGAEERRRWAGLLERTRDALMRHTGDGYAYRVYFRLRPHGSAGELVQSVDALARYYEGPARLWEIQALLKLRPVAGDMALGTAWRAEVREVLAAGYARDKVTASILDMRGRALQAGAAGGDRDVKTGPGGIRDLEFAVQGLQLVHGKACPSVLEGNTLRALRLLCEAGVLGEAEAQSAAADYAFLRRVEHYLQIMEDRQIHAVPGDGPALAALARRVLGPGGSADAFGERLEAVRERSHALYRRVMAG